MPPTPVLSLRSDRSRASASNPARPGGGADKPLGLVNAARRRSSVREPLRSALCTPVAALSSVAPNLPPPPPAVSAREGAPSVWKPFLLHGSLPLVQAPSLFFCLCCFFFSFALPRYVGSFLPFGRSEVFCQRSVCVL